MLKSNHYLIPLAGLMILLSGCGSTEPSGPSPAAVQAANNTMASEGTPAPLRAEYFTLLTCGEKDYVLHAMRLGLMAVRQGDREFAARIFDEAIKRVEAMQAGSEQAERSQSKFVGDEEKWFKGEAYERAALYLYRGLLYLDAGDFGNAAACAKRTQLMDISTHEEDQGDWYSAEWLLAYASLLQGDQGTATDALNRASKFYSKQGVVPPPTADGNLLVIVETGNAPIKARKGDYGEKLIILEGQNNTVKIDINPEGGTPVETAAAENIYFQASTRGKRKVDSILHGKAVFKSTTDVLGDVGIVGGAATLATSQSETQSLVGAGLLVAGLIGKGISAASNPAADIRTWDNLPHSIYFCSLPVPAGLAKVTIRGLDYQGVTVTEVTKEMTIDPQRKVNELWLMMP